MTSLNLDEARRELHAALSCCPGDVPEDPTPEDVAELRDALRGTREAVLAALAHLEERQP